MREFYRHELDELLCRVDFFAGSVADAVDLAGAALSNADAAAARDVVSRADDFRRLLAELDDRAIELIVRQQPVATDLRTIVAAMRMGTDLQRMGQLAVQIAEIAAARLPHHAVPDALAPTVSELAAATARLVAKVIDVVQAQDVQAALRMGAADDEVDRLRNALYRAVRAPDQRLSKADVMDMALIGRFYERIAEHAVAIPHHLAFRAGEVTLD